MGISLEPECRRLSELLRQQRSALLDEWSRRMPNSRLNSINRFADPVAYAFKAAAEAIYQALVEHVEPDPPAIEYAMKIKAVQGSDPSAAVEFIHLLKEIVRERISDLVSKDEWMRFESRIDRIAADASGMFKANRVKIGEMSGKVILPEAKPLECASLLAPFHLKCKGGSKLPHSKAPSAQTQ